MDLHMGNGGTNSNGHGEGKDENLNIVETIKKLQKDVQSHKDNNERLMKYKEQQEEFNMKLMQSLDIIENKLDKENGSSKSGSHRFPDEKRRTWSVRKPPIQCCSCKGDHKYRYFPHISEKVRVVPNVQQV
jgi:hypothetical protein